MKAPFLLLSLFLISNTFAQSAVKNDLSEITIIEDDIAGQDEEMNENDEIYVDDRKISILKTETSIIIPDAWDANFDDLLNSWYIKIHTDKLNHLGYHENIQISDSVIIDRLSKLPNIIELPYNQTVRNCINLYVERRRDMIERMLGLETYYFPIFEEALDKYGLPLELKYLAIVESALNPIVVSRAGASGIWQFMIGTGKNYGLEINSLVDERRDPIKSTDAACRHLKDLYDIYGDWHLAIAAYNCGMGNVNKAIRRANGQKDYWAIYDYLPRETRTYVPLFIAANYVMNYYAYHQLYPVETSLPFSTDTVMINQLIHFDQIAEVLQIDKNIIRALNPQYKQEIIPGNSKSRILTLPSMQAYAFVEKENEIASFRSNELFSNRTTINYSNTSDRTERIIHKVASGETILSIANKYGVSATSIRRWNGLGSGTTRVAAGRNLTLHVDNGGLSEANNSTSSVTAYSTTSTNRAVSHNTSTTDTERYRVRSGDSFYTIAQKYPGYSHSDLMKLNNTTKTALKVGQYILVPKI